MVKGFLVLAFARHRPARRRLGLLINTSMCIVLDIVGGSPSAGLLISDLVSVSPSIINAACATTGYLNSMRPIERGPGKLFKSLVKIR